MPSSPSPLAALGLDALLADPLLLRDPAGQVFEATGLRAAGLTPAGLRSLRTVLEREAPGTWPPLLRECGAGTGRATAARIDALLRDQGQPALADLPLDAALTLVSRAFAALGWGRLVFDLSLAGEHGLVLAAVENSVFAEDHPVAATFVDAAPAGFLAAVFEHLTGQRLACEEIACRSCGAPHCRFVITAVDRLAPLVPFLGRESADALIARLRQ
jgi:hypothetical protein